MKNENLFAPLPYLPKKFLLSDIKYIENECSLLCINTKGTRIEAFRLAISGEKEFEVIFRDLIEDLGHENIGGDFQLIKLKILREIQELQFILQGIKTGNVKGFEKKLIHLIKGQNFREFDQNRLHRDQAFEMVVGSYFAISGYKVDLEQETDIVATKGNTQIYVECKRVSSDKSVPRRVKEAQKQIEKRLPKNGIIKKRYGVIFVDVSMLCLDSGDFTIGATIDHARRGMRQRLNRVVDNHGDNIRSTMTSRTLFTSLHCITPIVTALPPQMTTFSTHYQCIPKKIPIFSICRTFAMFEALLMLRSPNLSWPLKTVPLFGRDGGFDLWHGSGIRMKMF